MLPRSASFRAGTDVVDSELIGMALLKTAVFIASRFQEFAELRDHLRRKIADYPVVDFAPVDLNDGSVSHRPPLEKCLGFVRRSEFMILLVGDTYGSLAPGFEKSFTHLEYEEATREGASTRVLVFMIGESYREGRILHSEDPTFAAWQGQLEARHTLGYLPPELSVEEKADRIFDQLLAALYEMRFGALSVDIDDRVQAELFEAVSEDALDDSEVTVLERRDAQLRGVDLEDADEYAGNPMAALLQPAAVAAREQLQEASRAIELRDYGVAVTHLRRAVDFKPLDMRSNYWLAQLYISLGRKDKLAEAEELADRAARIAAHDDLRVRAAAAYMLAARAALGADRREEGLRYATQAVEEAPWFARAHVELARQQVASGLIEQAVESIRTAYRSHSGSLKEVYGDPAFRSIRGRINALVGELKARLRGTVEKLRESSREMAGLYGERVQFAALDEFSLPRLVEEGRREIREQHRRVCEALATKAAAEQALGDADLGHLPISAEAFRFNREPDAIHIICWHKRIGDAIYPEDVVFTFRFNNSSKALPFVWRRGPIRLYRALEDDVQVATDAPWLFDHVPVHVQIPERTPGQLLREARGQAMAELNSARERRALCQAEIDANGPLGPFILGGVGLVVLVCGLAALAVGQPWGWVGLAGMLLLIKMFQLRRHRAALLARLDGIVQAESRAEQDDQQLCARLRELEENAARAANSASTALRLFERRALSQRATLVPFKTLVGAQPGGLIRVQRETLSRGTTEQGRAIRVVDGLLGLDAMSGDNGRDWHLFRVQEMNEREVLLSRQAAYRRG